MRNVKYKMSPEVSWAWTPLYVGTDFSYQNFGLQCHKYKTIVTYEIIPLVTTFCCECIINAYA